MATKRGNVKGRRTKGAQHSKNSSKSVKKATKYDQIPANDSTISYEEAVLRNIIQSSSGSNVPDEAYLLSTTLSNLTGNMKDMHYHSGVSIGRALYRINDSRKNYSASEESVSDLVSFFESVGYKSVTYSVFPDKVILNIYSKDGLNLGTNVHTFEAGIISGFLSAGRHQLVNVAESECINNKGKYCRFSSTYYHNNDNLNMGVETLDKLVDHMNNKRVLKQGHTLANGYYSLSSSMMFNPSYVGHMKSIASYMGSGLGTKLFSSYRKNSNSRSLFSSIEHTIHMLNFGTARVKSVYPLDMRLSFDKLNSKKEFVDISLAFINGLFSGQVSGRVVAHERSNNGAYVVEIRERKR